MVEFLLPTACLKRTTFLCFFLVNQCIPMLGCPGSRLKKSFINDIVFLYFFEMGDQVCFSLAYGSQMFCVCQRCLQVKTLWSWAVFKTIVCLPV